MKMHHFASLLALALPLTAQTEVKESPATPASNTETLWKISSSGIGG